MVVTFNVSFHEHLPDDQISNLKAILLSAGIARDGTDDFVFDVQGPSRVSGTAIKLNNWVECGFVSSWTSTPQLSSDTPGLDQFASAPFLND